MFWDVKYLAIFLTICNIFCPTKSLSLTQELENDRRHYVAAVYEHSRLGEMSPNPVVDLENNLKVYEQVAHLAAKKGAMILVFPEAGLYKLKSRDQGMNVFESAPDPHGPMVDHLQKQLRPCDNPEHAVARPIQLRLSCLAQQVKMYLVINMGTKETCLSGDTFLGSSSSMGVYSDRSPTDTNNLTIIESNPFLLSNGESCRGDGRRNYNTNIVFAPDGSIVARYRKRHLFNEEHIYDAPSRADRSYFDTPFGRFGLMICFDLVFADPAIELVLRDQVDSIIFSARWFDELPLFSATSSQAAWSYAMNVNLLAANSHTVMTGTVGSGIYAGRYGPVVYKGVDEQKSGRSWLTTVIEFLFGRSATKVESSIGSRLLIGVLPRSVRQVEKEKFLSDSLNSVVNVVVSNETKIIVPNENDSMVLTRYNHMSMEKANRDVEIELTKLSATVKGCNTNFCCELDYSINPQDARAIEYLEQNKLTLLIRNSVRPGRYNWYEQVCSLSVSRHILNGKRTYVTHEGVRFDRIQLKGNFSTPYVFAPASRDISTLVPSDKIDMKCQIDIEELKNAKLENVFIDKNELSNECQLSINNYEKELIAVALYGRHYSRDQIDEPADGSHSRIGLSNT